MEDGAEAGHSSAFDGEFQLGSEIGTGSLGVVYRGHSERMDKDVAIKVWHARFAEQSPHREQYDAEARALSTLEHPNLVSVTDYGIAGEAPYLIMDLLAGETLEDRLHNGPLAPEQVATLMEGVLRGLGYMHMRGVAHRNLKPDNVIVQLDADGTEEIKLIDFSLDSIAANTNAGGLSPAPLSVPSAYDAPEQLQGQEVDGRADVYAAGLLLVHMLTGREPTPSTLRAGLDDGSGGRLVPGASPALDAFIARATADNRQERFGNGDQMLRAMLELPTPWVEFAPDMSSTLAGDAGTDDLMRRDKELPRAGERESVVADAAAALLAAAASEPQAQSTLGIGASEADLAAAALASGSEPSSASSSADGLRAAALGSSADELRDVALDGNADELRAAALDSSADAFDSGVEYSSDVAQAPSALAVGDTSADLGPELGLPAFSAAQKEQTFASEIEHSAAPPQIFSESVWDDPKKEPGWGEDDDAIFEDSTVAESEDDVDLHDAALGFKATLRKRRLRLALGAAGLALALGGAAFAMRAIPDGPEVEPASSERNQAASDETPDRLDLDEGDRKGAPQDDGDHAQPALADPSVESAQDARDGEGANDADRALDPEETAEQAGLVAQPDPQHVSGEEAALAEAELNVAHEEDAPAVHVPENGEPHAHDADAVEEKLAAVAEADSDADEAAPVRDEEPAKKTQEPEPPLGAVRHVPPNQAEIRQLLALAIRPKPVNGIRNPWDVRLPHPLQVIREAILGGARGKSAHVKALQRYNATNPDDIYGHLLLAGIYKNRGWSLDALDQLHLAAQIDPSSRGAPEMLTHPLEMIVDDVAASDAQQFFERNLGREALPAISRALARRDLKPAVVARLKALSKRLSRTKRR